MTGKVLARQLLREMPALQQLREAVSSDPAPFDPDAASDLRWQRCVQRLCRYMPIETLRAQIDELLAAAGPTPECLLPTAGEAVEHILSQAAPLRARLPDASIELNLSTPAACPDRVCLGLVIRLHPTGRAWQVKIRIAAFVHPVAGLHWEVGYVDVRRSLQHFRANYLGKAAHDTDPSMLRAMVASTAALASRRPAIRGLDLTPAHFHVLRLCLAVGGKPPSGFDLPAWEQRILAATRHTLSTRSTWPDRLHASQLAGVKPRYLASWMFEHRLMVDPASGEPMVWSPPRLVRTLASGSSMVG